MTKNIYGAPKTSLACPNITTFHTNQVNKTHIPRWVWEWLLLELLHHGWFQRRRPVTWRPAYSRTCTTCTRHQSVLSILAGIRCNPVRPPLRLLALSRPSMQQPCLPWSSKSVLASSPATRCVSHKHVPEWNSEPASPGQVLTSSERSRWRFRSFCLLPDASAIAGHLETSLCSTGAALGSNPYIGRVLLFVLPGIEFYLLTVCNTSCFAECSAPWPRVGDRLALL